MRRRWSRFSATLGGYLRAFGYEIPPLLAGSSGSVK